MRFSKMASAHPMVADWRCLDAAPQRLQRVREVRAHHRRDLVGVSQIGWLERRMPLDGRTTATRPNAQDPPAVAHRRGGHQMLVAVRHGLAFDRAEPLPYLLAVPRHTHPQVTIHACGDNARYPASSIGQIAHDAPGLLWTQIKIEPVLDARHHQSAPSAVISYMYEPPNSGNSSIFDSYPTCNIGPQPDWLHRGHVRGRGSDSRCTCRGWRRCYMVRASGSPAFRNG